MRNLIALVLTVAVVAIAYAQNREPGSSFCPKVAERLAGGDATKKQSLIDACLATERFLQDQGPIPKAFKWDYTQNEADADKARQALVKIMLNK
ncbi:MAG: hypothetical protein HZB91_11445 [Elusimicrobia bacterium]|nr:hypothetical protein [Elusimicrobiota bacterium]